MILSELIEELNNFLADCGDIEVLIGDSYNIQFMAIDSLEGSFYHHEETRNADLDSHSEAETGEKSCQYGEECEVENAPIVALIWTA